MGMYKAKQLFYGSVIRMQIEGELQSTVKILIFFPCSRFAFTTTLLPSSRRGIDKQSDKKSSCHVVVEIPSPEKKHVWSKSSHVRGRKSQN